MTDTYTTKLDMQTGTINICGGDTRFQFVIDEVPEIIESLKSEYERAKQIMGNPLLDTRLLDEAMAHYTNILNSGGNAITLKPLVEFYQNTLVMLRELDRQLYEISDLIASCSPETAGDKSDLLYSVNHLKFWQERIAAILEAHKHHIPAIDEHG